MKTTHKYLALFMVFAMLLAASSVIASAANIVYELPVDTSKWISPSFDTDHAYSFAFVPDTKFLTIGDHLLGTNKLELHYSYIANSASERKLEHVFVLGDMTADSRKNDANLAGAHYNTPVTGEWELVKAAISQLDGVVPYSLVRGDHDDYMLDDYFNVPEYTSQFEGCGGFYADPDAKQGGREKNNPDNCRYWSAISGCHDESIVNSYKTTEISGTKYLFITYDYHPTPNVINWLDSILGEYPDHKAIITTHAYMKENGERIYEFEDTGITPASGIDGTNPGQVIWKKVLKKHSNVFMVVSTQKGDEYVNYSTDVGDNGNTVLQVLVNPEKYDTREYDNNGNVTSWSGEQDIGLVLYMNFSADGEIISFNSYSTLLGKSLKDADFTINAKGEKVDNSELAAHTPTVAPTTTVSPATTSSAKGCKSSYAVAYAAILPAVISVVFFTKKKEEI